MSENIFMQSVTLIIGLTTIYSFDIGTAVNSTFSPADEESNTDSNLGENPPLNFQNKDYCISYLTAEIDFILQQFDASKTRNNVQDLKVQLAVEKRLLQHEIEKNDELFLEIENSITSELERRFKVEEALKNALNETERLKVEITKLKNSSVSNSRGCEQEIILLKKNLEAEYQAKIKNITEAAVRDLQNEIDRLNDLLQKEKENLSTVQKESNMKINEVRLSCPCNSTCYNQLVDNQSKVEKERDTCQHCILVKKLSCIF